MRLTTVLLLATLLQVSAAGFAQKIAMSRKNSPLKAVIKDLRAQSGYDFIYTDDLLEKAKPVTITVKGEEFEKVLQEIFDNQPLSYQIEDKTVTIKEKQPGFFETIITRFQAIDVRGKVVDENGSPLPGASVKVKAKNQVTMTNENGEFTLQNVAEESILEISYVGYLTKEVKAEKELGLISLTMSSGELEEVAINKGYYTTKQDLNTGSVGTISAKQIANQPVSNVLSALQGRIPGLYISDYAGIPGARPVVSLRGRNSINNGIEPLYIIDGIPYDSKSLSQLTNATGTANLSPFMNIRPGDIERIDVLKDADATAIYGSRGANGVILITTKSGKTGKTAVNFDITRGAAVVANRLKLLNTQQYLEMRNEANKNDNVMPADNEYDVNGVWDKNRYTDWQDVLIGNTANTTDVKASVSGGNELTKFLIGLGYRKEGTIFPGNFFNQIGSGNFNINHRSENQRFKVNLGSNYSVVDSKLPTTNFAEFIFLPPNAPAIYKANGEINFENNTFDNPFAQLSRTSTALTKNLISNLSLDYNILDGLNISGKFGYNNIYMDELTIIPYSSFMPLPGDNQSARREKNVGFNQTTSYIIEPQINYSFSIQKHHFETLAGATFNQSANKRSTEITSGYGNDYQIRNSGSATNTENFNSDAQYRYNAVYFRLGYNYAEKYILNLTGRRDGSSRFGPGRQFGNFGAIGAAWNFGKEAFIVKNLPFFSLGKLRGSIGTTGNDQFTDYEFISAYGTGTQYFGISNLNPSRLTNTDYRWERINKIEGALELGFLKNRILVNANYFRNRTSNQLVGLPLPATAGFTSVRANLPATVQNTGFEFEVLANRIVRGKLNWDASFNLTVPKNKLVSYPGIERSGSNNSLYAVGYPLSISFLYEYAGLDRTTGQYTFVDRNKSGSIDPKDRYPRFVGQHYFGGLSNSLSYGGFSLDVFFQYVKQTRFKFQSNRVAGSRYFDFQTNQPTDVLGRWQTVGDAAEIQKFVSGRNTTGAFTANEQFFSSDGMLVDASFIRLKNVALSYSLPESWLKSVKVHNARIYIQGQNLLTITSFKGSDPENPSSLGNFPRVAALRVMTAGFQLTL